MFSVNQLRLGTITATDYCLGSIPVQKMYMGSVLVFDRTPAEETKYFFEVSPTSDIEFDALDSTKTLTVTSYSQVYSGDSPSGPVTPVTPSIQNPEFIINDIVNNEDGTFTITLKANDYYQDEDGSLSKRNDTITISQSQSGDNAIINVSQSPIVPTVQNRWLRLEYAAEEDQYITVNKSDVELPYVSDWKNYVFPKKSTGIKPIRWNAEITNQDFMHEVLAHMSQQTIVYVDEAEDAQENKSTYTAADNMCIATSNGDGLYFQELLKGSGIENGEVTFKIDGNGYWGQFYECFSGCRFNKVTIQFMQDNICISSMNRAFRAATIKELNILDSNGESSITKHFTARDLSGMCEWTSGITNFPDIIDWESLDNNSSTGLGWAFSYAIPLISITQHGSDRDATSNIVRCGAVIQAFQKCSNLQSIGPVLDVSRVPGQSSDNGKIFEGCTALTDVRIRNLNGPTWHFDDDIQSGNIPNLDKASVTYLFDNLMDLTKYNAEDTSGTKPKSDHGDLYCPAEWQDKIISDMIIAAAAKNWNIYIGGELQTVGDTKYTFTVPQPTISLPAEAESGNFTLSWESYKQDVVNGEVQETKTKVGVTTNSLEVPEWIQLSSQEEGELGNSLTFNFSNNTTADERSFTFNLTQQESSKKLTVVVTQSGADIETTYTWNVTPTTVTIDGTNTATINVTSYKQQWIGDIQQGSQTPVDFQYTNPGLEETIKANKVDNGNGSWTITLSGGTPSVETTYQMVFTANEGGNSTTVTVNKVANIQPEDLLAYGVEWDVTVADPTLTRIGNMQYHKTLPIQNGFKGCIYADGQIQYYLNPDDWRFREVPVYIEVSYNSDNHTLSSTGNFTDVVANANCYVDQYIKINNHICKITSASSNSMTISSTDINNEPVELESSTYTVEIGSCRNGADGIVCVEIPEFYYKVEADGNKHRMWVSSIQIDNTWTKQESLLIDAYKPTIRRVATAPSNGTNGGYIAQMVQDDIISIANTDVIFRGGNNSTTYDSALSTDIFKALLGKPLTNQTRVNMRTHMGNAIDIKQRLMSYEEYKNIFYWLYVIEYANFNSQAVYNGELTSEGYHQGGLGNGLTTGDWANWRSYNGNNPITPCGYGDDLGNYTGIKQITVDMSGSITFDMPRWRGFDNPFGDIWTNLDGILIDTPLVGDSDTGITTTCYIITNPSNYTDSLDNIGSVYSRKHTLPYNQGFIKERYTEVNGDIAPISIGGNATTYSCDCYWVNYDGTPETLLVGGGLHDGSDAGLGSFSCDYWVSHSRANVGFRTVRPKN